MPATLSRPFRTAALAWGYNNSGGLALGHSARVHQPARASLPAGTVEVQGGGEFTVARTTAGELYACGGNTYGQLGDGSTRTRLGWEPVPLPPGTFITSAQAGIDHVLALTAHGEVYAWGRNHRGQVGSGEVGLQLVPVQVIGAGVAALGAGRGTSAAVTREGQLLTWGRNGSGQTGLGATQDVIVPAASLLPDGVRAVTADLGYQHTVVVTSSGELLTYGAGPQGRPLPAKVPLDQAWRRVRAVSAGGSFTLALTSRGLLLAWGANEYGQLGLGDQHNRDAPAVVPVPPEAGPVTSFWAGDHSAAAVTARGEVYTWGQTRWGQGGTGPGTEPRTRPARVNLPPGTRPVSVSGGADHVIVTLAENGR
jgi:alpha-tubulin suppressor-like RCC1 family protein